MVAAVSPWKGDRSLHIECDPCIGKRVKQLVPVVYEYPCQSLWETAAQKSDSLSIGYQCLSLIGYWKSDANYSE